MTLVEQHASAIPIATACGVVGLSRATHYRRRAPSAPSTHLVALLAAPEGGDAPPSASSPETEIGLVERVHPPSPRRLADVERQQLLDTLHAPEFADQPPTEVYAALLSRGVYLASIRTMYRVLREVGETKERRNQRPPQSHAKPSLTATAPNQVWTWDITKLATTQKGIFYFAYVIIDLFSRYVVGWVLAEKECKHIASLLFSEAIARHGIEPGLWVHSDRGSSMKSDTLAQLLAELGVTRSFSRPHVSNDNAFSEAQFKTLKVPARLSREIPISYSSAGLPAGVLRLAQ